MCLSESSRENLKQQRNIIYPRTRFDAKLHSQSEGSAVNLWLTKCRLCDSPHCSKQWELPRTAVLPRECQVISPAPPRNLTKTLDSPHPKYSIHSKAEWRPMCVAAFSTLVLGLRILPSYFTSLSWLSGARATCYKHIIHLAQSVSSIDTTFSFQRFSCRLSKSPGYIHHSPSRLLGIACSSHKAKESRWRPCKIFKQGFKQKTHLASTWLTVETAVGTDYVTWVLSLLSSALARTRLVLRMILDTQEEWMVLCGNDLSFGWNFWHEIWVLCRHLYDIHALLQVWRFLQ